MVKDLITVHMLVKNEDRFIWYAISSIIPFVDRLLIFDTGSQDKTRQIVESFHSSKIYFETKVAECTRDIADLRQEQLDKTESSWFWIVDGDEIYPYSLCREILDIIKTQGSKLEGIVVRRYDLLGDIYHYQDESVGTYNLFGEKGHFAIRLINKKNIQGLYVKGKYPYEGYYDRGKIEIIHHRQERFRFTKGRLFHAMYLQKSSLGYDLSDTYHRNKYKVEVGHKLANNVSTPEVFNLPRPFFVSDATIRRSLIYELVAYIVTPIKVIKRKILTKVLH